MLPRIPRYIQGSISVYLVFDTLSVEEMFSEDTSHHHPNGIIV